MYTKFFNLSAAPFQLTPDPRFLFESSVHAKAIAHLQYGLNQSEGFIVVTGEVGAGKTTIIGHLLENLDRHKYVATTVVTTNISEDDIIRLIASGLGLPHEGRDKASMLIDIENFLYDCARRNKRCLIFVDEAQNLSTKTLEELRMLSNIHVDGQAPVQLFLLGQPQFRRTLAREDMLQLRHRVIASYHLGPLSEEDTREYILHRLKRVGWANDPAFEEEAFPLLYKYTEGVPRRINTLCSRLLLFCYLEELHRVDAVTVQDVAEDLEREFDQVLDHGEEEKPIEAAPSAPPASAEPPAQPSAQSATQPPAEPSPAELEASLTETAPQAVEAETQAPEEEKVEAEIISVEISSPAALPQEVITLSNDPIIEAEIFANKGEAVESPAPAQEIIEETVISLDEEPAPLEEAEEILTPVPISMAQAAEKLEPELVLEPEEEEEASEPEEEKESNVDEETEGREEEQGPATISPHADNDLLPLMEAVLPAFQNPQGGSLPKMEGAHWQEVIDLIESTPVEALAALGFDPQNAGEEEDDEAPVGPSAERAHNKIFKRLLLLILEEYLKDARTPEIHRH